MTGPEHYKRAEYLLRYAASTESDRARDGARDAVQEAQVHAMLALAAATAVTRERVLPLADHKAWAAIAGEPFEGVE